MTKKILATVLVCAGMTATSNAGSIDYTWQASQSTAVAGDVVTMTLQIEIDPEQGGFAGLAATNFDILIADAPAAGLIDNTQPGHGLNPMFVFPSSNGTVIGNNLIAGVDAIQLPPANTATSIDLYTFDYHIVDAAPRAIVFDVSVNLAMAYNGQGFGSEPYLATDTPFTLFVQDVPGPGALALLGCAGSVTRSRRRK